ncbi:EAL domain-containing protein [Paracoccus shanxieyensis]|uniref:EAL domain-containing protein n=1 Tax=Paracoccus shanxieyensis TaxID=2675752 RepID=UPI0018AD0621|nr:EAL domain-containing protein [Paracoccus shanxieyensis]
MPDPATTRLFQTLAVPGIRDWSDTPLGDPANGSTALRLAVRQLAQAAFPVCIAVGAAQRLVYNPAFAALIGPRHPAQFGQPLGAAGRLPKAERFALPSDDAELWLFWPPDPLCACGIDATTLRHATEANLLGVSYQPQIRMSDGAVAGFEALARWHHPELGEVSPEVFIPLAEKSGHIGLIGAWVLRRSLAEFGALAGSCDTRLAVNVSPLQLRDAGFADLVAGCLADAGRPAAQLELEITETARLGEDAQTRRTLADLRALGVGLALDDFGTGYSNFATLAQVSFDRLKLDRALIAGLPADRSVRLIRAMRHMADALGMELLVEGVETVEQARILRDLGCDLAQGYHFAPPLVLADAVTWLHARGAR